MELRMIGSPGVVEQEQGRAGMGEEHVVTVVGIGEILTGVDSSSKANRSESKPTAKTKPKKKKKKRKPVDNILPPTTPSPSSTTTNSSPAASPSLLDNRWFSVYDVFRCKQLHVELSALTASSHIRYSRSRSKSKSDSSKIDTSSAKSTAKISKEELHRLHGVQVPQQQQLELLDHRHRQEWRRENEQQEQYQHCDDLREGIILASGDEQDHLPQEELRRQQQQQQRERNKVELRRKMDMVRRLQSGGAEEQAKAAADIRAACRRDGEARTMLALMGAIPPLVGMLDSVNPAAAAAGLAALLNLSVRNDQNKAAIVAAGAVPKILRVTSFSPAQQLQMQLLESSVAALLSLSALDANKLTIAAVPGAAAALAATVLDDSAATTTRRDAMAALYNLSLCPANAPALVAAAAVSAVLSAAYEPELCSRAVATAANLASTPPGRRALARVDDSCLVFADILNWGRSGSYCPAASPYRGGGTVARGLIERAVYVVMVLAQCSQSQRRALCRAGCSSVLLELVLVGSPAVQDRASRTLQFLAAAEHENSSSSTTSYCCLLLQDDEGDDHHHHQQQQQQQEQKQDEQRREMIERELYSEERRAVNRLVEKSLKLNMQRITERACIPLAAANAAAAATSSPSSSSSTSLVTSHS